MIYQRECPVYYRVCPVAQSSTFVSHSTVSMTSLAAQGNAPLQWMICFLMNKYKHPITYFSQQAHSTIQSKHGKVIADCKPITQKSFNILGHNLEGFSLALFVFLLAGSNSPIRRAIQKNPAHNKSYQMWHVLTSSCWTCRSRNVRSFRTDIRLFGPLQPIDVPSPPFSLSTATWFSRLTISLSSCFGRLAYDTIYSQATWLMLGSGNETQRTTYIPEITAGLRHQWMTKIYHLTTQCLTLHLVMFSLYMCYKWMVVN